MLAFCFTIFNMARLRTVHTRVHMFSSVRRGLIGIAIFFFLLLMADAALAVFV